MSQGKFSFSLCLTVVLFMGSYFSKAGEKAENLDEKECPISFTLSLLNYFLMDFKFLPP